MDKGSRIYFLFVFLPLSLLSCRLLMDETAVALCLSLINRSAKIGRRMRNRTVRLVTSNNDFLFHYKKIFKKRFVLYKRPGGKSYVYRSSSTSGDTWIVSSQPIDSLSSLPGRTLEPLYRDPPGKVTHFFDPSFFIHFFVIPQTIF